jgi:hypothetical protein
LGPAEVRSIDERVDLDLAQLDVGIKSVRMTVGCEGRPDPADYSPVGIPLYIRLSLLNDPKLSELASLCIDEVVIGVIVAELDSNNRPRAASVGFDVQQARRRAVSAPHAIGRYRVTAGIFEPVGIVLDPAAVIDDPRSASA